MQAFLDYLNQNSGALNLLFAAVVAISTVIYAVLTWRLVSETRRMRQAQTEPQVAVTYKSRDEWISLIDVVVKNIGLGPAYDIKFEITPVTGGETTQQLISQLKERNFLNSGLSFLAPVQEIASFFTNASEKFEEKMASQVLIKASYKSATDKKYHSENLIDLSELRGIERIGEPPLHKIAKNIEAIGKDVKDLVTGFRHLKIDVYSSEDREKAETERKAHYEGIKERNKSHGTESGS